MDAQIKEGQEMADQTKRMAEDLSSRAKELGTAAWEKAKTGYEAVQDKTVAGAKATDRLIRDHPYQTLGIAFGVGLLLGVLMRRRD